MKIIALSGAQGVGKDTVAAMLYQNFGYRHYAFGDKVRAVLEEMNPFTGFADGYEALKSDLELCGGWDEFKEVQPGLYRRLMVGLGEGAKPHLGKDVWANALVDQIAVDEAEADEELSVVISDLRFPAEAELIRALDGYFCWINRPDHKLGMPELLDSPFFGEKFFHYIISNTGSLEYLEDNAIHLHRCADTYWNVDSAVHDGKSPMLLHIEQAVREEFGSVLSEANPRSWRQAAVGIARKANLL